MKTTMNKASHEKSRPAKPQKPLKEVSSLLIQAMQIMNQVRKTVKEKEKGSISKPRPIRQIVFLLF